MRNPHYNQRELLECQQILSQKKDMKKNNSKRICCFQPERGRATEKVKEKSQIGSICMRKGKSYKGRMEIKDKE